MPIKILKKIFKKDTGDTASMQAKERLTLTLAHERTTNIEYIEDLKRDILEVVKKYTNSPEVSFKSKSNKNVNSIEIDVKL